MAALARSAAASRAPLTAISTQYIAGLVRTKQGAFAVPVPAAVHTHCGVRLRADASTSPEFHTEQLSQTAAGTSVPGDVCSDERFMWLALEQAALASAADEVPVGAVLVSAAGELLAAAHNRTEGSSDPTAHAELLCIRQAATQLGGWRLLDATLYVTLEPCPMCAGALLQSRVGAVVYGARNTLLGADGSWIAMLPSSGDTNGSCCGDASMGSEQPGIAPAAAQAAHPGKPHPFHPHLQVRRGVLAAECSHMMRSFFARRRQQAAAAAAAAKTV